MDLHEDRSWERYLKILTEHIDSKSHNDDSRNVYTTSRSLNCLKNEEHADIKERYEPRLPFIDDTSADGSQWYTSHPDQPEESNYESDSRRHMSELLLLWWIGRKLNILRTHVE